MAFNGRSRLVGQDPFMLYERLCRRTKQRQDPCVLDVFMSITAFLGGAPPASMVAFTAPRKRLLKRQQPA
ncbi:MAG: helix-hairpin-helix domain-containing protein [Phycisphaerales bacterium]